MAAWLSGKFPRIEHGDIGQISALAKSILIALPGIAVFLLPFIFAGRWGDAVLGDLRDRVPVVNPGILSALIFLSIDIIGGQNVNNLCQY